ncbi:NADH-quinone oxidoreductase subunit H [Microbacterium sp. LRZ72]|uniref:complex I subunit 1 family protein n=1 Tax=Microbacterium sp. LRZ72 TaxID=2942481 RepID=UPI0029A39E7C|nr:complex I subunit 1 family protein [Microbacterium sp. LRZ72]MDX2376065.1 NADH-quinone oxidoreductase subunit H [Microbacterium sp. LRZ72]
MPEPSPWIVLGTAVTLGGLLAALTVVAVTADALLSGAGRTPVRTALAAPWCELLRLLRQPTRRLPQADTLLWAVGRYGLIVIAALKLALVPVFGEPLISSPVGIVAFNALDVAIWAAVWLAGWGPNSTYPLIGGYRFLALAIAYELPLMFALTAPAIAAGSLDVAVIAAAQEEGLWYAVLMPVALLVYCLAVLALTVSGPFAAPFGADIAGGVGAELSGTDRLMLVAGRYAVLVSGAAFAVPLFLGGGAGPVLPGWAWVVIKTTVVLVTLVAIRRAIPLVRPERFLEVGWVVLLPLIIVQDFVVAVGAVAAGEG